MIEATYNLTKIGGSFFENFSTFEEAVEGMKHHMCEECLHGAVTFEHLSDTPCGRDILIEENRR
jgi:hypothetical protein